MKEAVKLVSMENYTDCVYRSVSKKNPCLESDYFYNNPNLETTMAFVMIVLSSLTVSFSFSAFSFLFVSILL